MTIFFQQKAHQHSQSFFPFFTAFGEALSFAFFATFGFALFTAFGFALFAPLSLTFFKGITMVLVVV